jgi:hypothetical protein
MDKPTHTKTTVSSWGFFYLICSVICFLLLLLFGLDKLQKATSEGIAYIALAIGVLLQGITVFSITRTLDATNRMCAYLVEVAKGDEKEESSGSYKDPWVCPICKQQNSYWDEKCVKCGHTR